MSVSTTTLGDTTELRRLSRECETAWRARSPTHSPDRAEYNKQMLSALKHLALTAQQFKGEVSLPAFDLAFVKAHNENYMKNPNQELDLETIEPHLPPQQVGNFVLDVLYSFEPVAQGWWSGK